MIRLHISFGRSFSLPLKCLLRCCSGKTAGWHTADKSKPSLARLQCSFNSAHPSHVSQVFIGDCSGSLDSQNGANTCFGRPLAFARWCWLSSSTRIHVGVHWGYSFFKILILLWKTGKCPNRLEHGKHCIIFSDPGVNFLVAVVISCHVTAKSNMSPHRWLWLDYWRSILAQDLCVFLSMTLIPMKQAVFLCILLYVWVSM